MELIITEIDSCIKPRLCLNMIVKNESHIIENTLDKLLKKIPFDYWVISDTGSTDNTKQIITNFFTTRNIPGELFDDEWKDFGHNRTKALEHAHGKSDYLLLFDADDEICGDFILPELTKDSYALQFGDVNGTSYTRPQIITNHKKWKYIGVLHEILVNSEDRNSSTILDTIKGNYYTISGRTSARNQDKNKYSKDASILEKAYEIAINNKDTISNRYSFYCANSYYDSGKYEQAIKWYKIAIDNDCFPQEKYIACLNIYICYKVINRPVDGLGYLVKSVLYDRERVECIYELVLYYCLCGLNDVAYGYYNLIKPFYAEKYLEVGLQGKLFLDVSKGDFLLPYYTILVCDKMKDYATIVQMYKIVFTKKLKAIDQFFIGNILYNLQFFIETVKDDKVFMNLFKEYVEFLPSINYPVFEQKFMNNFEKYGIINPNSVISIFKKEEYFKSKKILIYTGYMNFLWNDSTVKTQSIGGAEKAVVYLSRQFPKDFDIYIVGDQLEEQIGNISYINRNKLQQLLNQNEFHTIIISRYVSFFEEYNNIKCYKLLLYAHDSTGFINNYNRRDINYILEQYNDYVDKVVCLTNWHSNNIIERHPFLKDKIEIINNGINIVDFPTNKIQKCSNKFVWSSCAYRGLHILLNLWSDILDILPDATLDICSYDSFPKNKEEEEMLKTINRYDSITYRGKLNTSELYDLMAKSEYWLYTNTFPETSCITGMEMLMSEVICVYYPLAGLVDTVGDYGIPVERGQEIETIVNLTNKRKTEIRKRGKEYALSCSWENRAKKWCELLTFSNLNNDIREKIWVFHPGQYYYTSIIQYLENLTDNNTKTVVSNDIDYINNLNPHEITFLLNPYNPEPIVRDSIFKFNTKTISFLQLEPLSLNCHLNKITSFFDKHSYLKQYPIYDYSKSNIRILNKNGFTNCIHLPYKCSRDELDFLIKAKTNNKIYDFGFIYDWKLLNHGSKTLPVKPPRRNKIMEFLIKNGFTVNLIAGYGEDRDSELGKCKIILNPHGQINENPNPSPDECSNIFEHIRCDRLLKAGYTILSETSYDLDTEFINQYPNLKIINYEDFFNLDVIKNIIYELNIKNIYDTLCLNQNPFNYYLNPVDIHEHLPTLYKYATECNSILECGVRASVSSWALAYGLLNNNSDTKKLILNDISPCDISNLLKCTKNITNLNISYQWINDLDIILNENNDLTFIDTWHVGGHLKKELDKFSKLTNKYIIMHDTTVDEFTSEAIRAKLSEEQLINLSASSGLSIEDIKMGLWPAIEDFLKNNPDWDLHERYTNNNGLTILKKKPSKKIVDCFTFYNELELLKYRLTILNEYVDYFVLVEATHTHVGKEKPLFYQENKELFKEFNHKIIHIIVEDFSHKYPDINIENEEQWNNERFQRNCIKRGLDKLKLNDDDIFTVTDLDEIPDPKLLKKIKANEVIIDANIIELDLYYYNLNCKMDHLWHLSKIISYKKYKELGFSCEQIRQNMSFKIIENAGWHLSYFGDEKFIKNKIENFGHQEYNNDKFTDEEKIKKIITSQTDLYGRPNTIVNIPIEDNDNLPPKYDIYLKRFYKTTIQNIETNTKKNIAFFIRHFTERGTEVSSYDYANYNETLLDNKSYIIHFSDEAQKKYGFPDVKDTFEKFKSRFEMIEINDITDMNKVISKYKLDFFYTQTHGGNDIYQFENKTLWGDCKSIKHCVFNTMYPESDYYISISCRLNEKNNTNIPVIPYIVELPDSNNNLRNELNITNDAIVFGRHGGFNQFDLPISHEAIISFLDDTINGNVYFLFMNTNKFYEHPRIIYLEKNIDLLYKTKFINTCDAMIHARSDGETFGLAIGEFSSKNKPIITCPCGDTEHIKILGNKAIIYENKEQLFNIFLNIREIIKQNDDWNCYKNYTPENIMNLFNNIFLGNSQHIDN